MNLTVDRLRDLLLYSAETGQFTWKVDRGNATHARDVAGLVDTDGYRIVRVDRCRFMAHRLAWFYVHGAWPAHHLDHVNGHRDDNRICNLREATPGQNCQNIHGPLSSNRTSRFLGVSWKAREGKWRAQIQVAGRRKELGLFSTEEAAYEAYLAAKRQLHPFQTLAA